MTRLAFRASVKGRTFLAHTTEVPIPYTNNFTSDRVSSSTTVDLDTKRTPSRQTNRKLALAAMES